MSDKEQEGKSAQIYLKHKCTNCKQRDNKIALLCVSHNQNCQVCVHSAPGYSCFHYTEHKAEAKKTYWASSWHLPELGEK